MTVVDMTQLATTADLVPLWGPKNAKQPWDPAAWHVVAYRDVEASDGEMTQDLAMRRTASGFKLAQCGDPIIGEVPVEWFEEDGETPLPAYRDADGDLKPPALFDGQEVAGWQGCSGPGAYLLGHYGPDPAKVPIPLTGNLNEVELALWALDWEGDIGTGHVVNALRYLQGLPPITQGVDGSDAGIIRTRPYRDGPGSLLEPH